jgi:hypothetical protein
MRPGHPSGKPAERAPLYGYDAGKRAVIKWKAVEDRGSMKLKRKEAGHYSSLLMRTKRLN